MEIGVDKQIGEIGVDKQIGEIGVDKEINTNNISSINSNFNNNTSINTKISSYTCESDYVWSSLRLVICPTNKHPDVPIFHVIC